MGESEAGSETPQQLTDEALTLIDEVPNYKGIPLEDKESAGALRARLEEKGANLYEDPSIVLERTAAGGEETIYAYLPHNGLEICEITYNTHNGKRVPSEAMVFGHTIKEPYKTGDTVHFKRYWIINPELVGPDPNNTKVLGGRHIGKGDIFFDNEAKRWERKTPGPTGIPNVDVFADDRFEAYGDIDEKVFEKITQRIDKMVPPDDPRRKIQ